MCTCSHPTHQDILLLLICLFLLNAPICTASPMLRGVFVFVGPCHLHHCQETFTDLFLANRSVNLQSCINTKARTKVWRNVWCYLLNHEVIFVCIICGPQEQMVPCVLNMMFYLISLMPWFSPLRASCFAGSHLLSMPRTERSQATRSDTGKDPGGARQPRPPEAPSLTSSLMVMGSDPAALIASFGITLPT